jgi:transposase-like protein
MDNGRQDNMPRRRYTPEEIIGKLREAEVLLSQGQSVARVARALTIKEQTRYRWRKEHGGLPGRHRDLVAFRARGEVEGP